MTDNDWNDPSQVEQVIWQMRLADLPRGENRAVLDRLYNGNPPFDQSKAEENNVQINRAFLEGPNLLSQGRRQWNNAFLKTGNYFTVALDYGPTHKRSEWSHSITRNANRILKRDRQMMEQKRATGASVMLHGIGPVNWKDRRCPVPTPIPISSLMIPSETDLDFDNLTYLSVFREYTPAQLYNLTHGPKRDPGWNMELVKSQLEWVCEQKQKGVSATAYQYMPERIEELIKQDGGGFWQSDAVPTVDVWDFYYRPNEDGIGWCRRMVLDWGVAVSESTKQPDFRGQFLYDSKKRKYANSLSEILHCQFGDCSAVAPFKYHSVRSLGWMLWGVCELQDRLRCRFSESVFEQLMWFFRVASGSEFERIKKAMFTHMGVIPQGVSFVAANDRFKPDYNLIQMAFQHNRQIMGENASSFTQDFEQGKEGEMTATETMARVNAVNTMVSGMLNLAYEYERYKDTEICRRLCIKHSPYKAARDFRLACLRDGVPEEMLNVECWIVEPERVIGGGNKTLELAQANALLGLRKNLSPEAQRRVDHIAAEAFTDDPALAETLAPVKGMKTVSNSQHDAALATGRLLAGLSFQLPKEAVIEEYVEVWLNDMGIEVNQIKSTTNMGTMRDVIGLANLAMHINGLLEAMSLNEDDREKVRAYGDILGKLMNEVKGFAQRLREQSAEGDSQIDPKDIAKIQAMKITALAKAANTRESHAERTAQRTAQFELEEQRKDRETAASIRRKNAEFMQELLQKQRLENEPEP